MGHVPARNLLSVAGIKRLSVKSETAVRRGGMIKRQGSNLHFGVFLINPRAPLAERY